MFRKILISIFAALFVISVLPISLSAASVVSVPGGVVTSYDELYTAIGGEATSVIKKNDKGETVAIQIFENIELAAPVKIISGEYVIYGAGATVTASYKDGSFFEVSGENTILVIGNPEGSTTIDTTFNGNEISRSGSVLTVDAKAKLVVYSGTVFKNIVTTASGGAVSNKGELILYGGKFEKCRAVVSGGAVYNEGEAAFAAGSMVECSSDLGGAIYNGGKATFIGTEIETCMADKGGAIYNASEVKFVSSTVSECKARLGGAIYNEKNCELLGGSISNCSSENGEGGAIYNVSELVLTAGSLNGNISKKGGNIYNNGILEMNKNIAISSGKAENGGNIYNDTLGKINSKGGSVTLGKADFGGGVFNLGEMALEGANYHSNRANIAGNGILNHGIVNMTKNGYVDPDNDFFVVLSEDNAHALKVLAGWEYDKQIVKLSCGVATETGYEYKESVGDTLIINQDDTVVIKDRFALYNKNGLILNENGRLAKAPGNYTEVFYIIGAVAAFAAVVAAIVITVRFFDKKKSSANGADDYF